MPLRLMQISHTLSFNPRVAETTSESMLQVVQGPRTSEKGLQAHTKYTQRRRSLYLSTPDTTQLKEKVGHITSKRAYQTPNVPRVR